MSKYFILNIILFSCLHKTCIDCEIWRRIISIIIVIISQIFFWSRLIFLRLSMVCPSMARTFQTSQFKSDGYLRPMKTTRFLVSCLRIAAMMSASGTVTSSRGVTPTMRRGMRLFSTRRAQGRSFIIICTAWNTVCMRT